MRQFLAFFITTVSAALTLPARAADTTTSFLQGVGSGANYDTSNTDLPTYIANIINIFLSILGVFFLVLMVYGGYLWMNARGNEEQVKKAKEVITNALIGLVIILLAYSISRFVVTGIIRATYFHG